MKKRREESLANPLPENNPEWEEMEEVLVSMDVDGWEIYVKETRPKGQRLPNEVDPERAQLQQAPLRGSNVVQRTMFAANDKITHATMSFVVTLSFAAKHTFWHFDF